jgi:hypothetical protein
MLPLSDEHEHDWSQWWVYSNTEHYRSCAALSCNAIEIKTDKTGQVRTK